MSVTRIVQVVLPATGVSNSSHVRWTLISRCTTVFVNVYCTFVILFRIVRVRGLRKSLAVYRGIIEILLESAVLYTGVYLAYIGLDVHTVYFVDGLDQRAVYVLALLPAVTGLAPTLILARVAAGHAAPRDAWRSGASSWWRRELATPFSRNDLDEKEDRVGVSPVELASAGESGHEQPHQNVTITSRS